MKTHFVPLTEEERQELADSVIINLIRLDELIEAQAKEKAEMKHRRKEIEGAIAETIEILRNGGEIRGIEDNSPALPF